MGKIACLSMDLEADLRSPDKRCRLLEDDGKLDGLLGLLGKEGVPLTCFTVMSLAHTYPDELRAIDRRSGIEMAVHSMTHDQSQPASQYEIETAWNTFADLFGRAPGGYRSPNCLIDEAGLLRLAKQGYRYDSSIVPSVRFDQYGYNNLHYARTPFRFAFADAGITELPIACLAGLRLPFTFSYAKLLGLSMYSAASALFPLPDVVVTFFHPYDLYVREISDHIPGWKKHAHLRNADRATAILADCIAMLKRRGYSFVKMGDLVSSLERDPALPAVRVDGPHLQRPMQLSTSDRPRPSWPSTGHHPER